MKRILVIGGTGNIGGQVIAQLSCTNARVRALVRSPAASHLPSTVEVMQGDLTRPETLDACVDGMESVFLVWTAPAAAAPAALERICRLARRVVFLSAPLKTPHPFFQQPNPARVLAEQVERTIESSGVEWIHLRPGMFALNALHFWGPQIRAGDVVRWPYLSAPTAPTDERDIAAVAVRTLVEEGHAGKEYVLTGPESLTQREQIATIGSALGRRLVIEEQSREDALREPLAGMPQSVVLMLLNAWAAAVGQPAFVSSTFQELTGKPARTFREWTTANLAAFRRPAP